MYYVEHKINNMSGNNDVIGTASNPFSAHDPYIRIEQRYSTLSENEKLVIAFDETKEIKSLLGTHTFTAHDHTKYRAFKIKVYGNGAENGAILFSVRDASNYKRDDFFVPTSHTGWKEFILIDPDNIDYDLTKYGFNGINTFWSNWDSRGGSPNYAALNSVTIATSGNVAGVMIDDIKAYNIVDAPAKNPSITIGANTITFDAEIRSGEFIEYYPDSKKAYLHYYTQFYDEAGNWLKNEAHTKEISYTGSVTAPAGSFNFEYNGESVSGAPLRARVKIGLQGQIVANPDSWVAPEIDMGNATLDIRIK